MAWRRIGDKPLSEPMLAQFTDIYLALGGDELNEDSDWNHTQSNMQSDNNLRSESFPMVPHKSWVCHILQQILMITWLFCRILMYFSIIAIEVAKTINCTILGKIFSMYHKKNPHKKSSVYVNMIICVKHIQWQTYPIYSSVNCP